MNGSAGIALGLFKTVASLIAPFCKCIRQIRRKLKPFEVVAICDHLRFFFFSQLKHKVFRKSTDREPCLPAGRRES
jgi:hypothetical protein